MSCCGRPRAPVAPAAVRRETPPAETQRRHAVLNFTYTGSTRLQAEGPVTRQRYRFDHPGATVAVDIRDAPSLAAVPNLKRS